MKKTSKTKSRKKDYLDAVWDQTTLGGLISALRSCDEVSQKDLAEKIGVSPQFLSSVEHNKKTVGVKFIMKVAKALDYPPEAFLELFVRDWIAKDGPSAEVKITLVG